MKTLLIAASFLTVAQLAAQESAPADHLLGNPNAPAAEDPVRRPLPPENAERGPRGPNEDRRREFIRERTERIKESGINRDEMRKLRDALEGIAQNETVRALRAEAEKSRQALREALQAYAKAKGLPAPGERPAEGVKPERPNPEKLAEIRKAMEGARNDPAVKAAFEKGKEVGKKLREAVRAALLEKDATLAPILDKLGDNREGLLNFGPEPRGSRKGDGAAEEGRPRGPRGPRKGEGEGQEGPRPPMPPDDGEMPPPEGA